MKIDKEFLNTWIWFKTIKKLKEYYIDYDFMDPEYCSFDCKRKTDGRIFRFDAKTGKIEGSKKTGLKNLIKILNGKIPS